MGFKFIHAADLHLDSPFLGLERYEGAPLEEMRGATRQALINLVDLALNEQAAFVVIAGDLYDGDLTDYNTALFLTGQLNRLAKTGVRVYIVQGNHDAQTRITKKLSLPENTFMLSHTSPQTLLVDGMDVAVHGRSYPRSATSENLSLDYPAARPGIFNLGILHTALSGRAGHQPYAPCSPADLAAKNYQYWALGHVHQQEVVEIEPYIVFSGCTQGRHIREEGAKGCYLVEVRDGLALPPVFHPLDKARWAVCRLEAEELEAPEDLPRLAAANAARLYQEAEGRLLAVRLVITGRTEAHQALVQQRELWLNETRAQVSLATGDRAWVEKIILETAGPLSLMELAAGDTAVADLFSFIEDLGQDREPEAMELIRQGLKDFAGKLPQEMKAAPFELDPEDTETLRRYLGQARDLLAARLIKTGAAR